MLVSIGMDHVLGEMCYKRIILQRSYKKMTILWPFSYNSFVKFHGEKWNHKIRLIFICAIAKCVINEPLVLDSLHDG